MDEDEYSNDTDIQNTQENYETNMGIFFLKMLSVLHISEMAVQEILQDFYNLHQQSKSLLSESLDPILQKRGFKDSAIKNEIVSVFVQHYPFCENTTKAYTNNDSKGTFSTAKLRMSYYKNKTPFVQPIQYTLGTIEGKEKTYVYVPVLNVLKTFLAKHDIMDKVLQTSESKPGVYSTFRDGTNFKTNGLFKDKCINLQIALYNDDWETGNPLGTSRKKHKISAFYWSVLNLPSEYRSVLHSMQLAILCKSDDISNFGHEAVLALFLRDIALLEKQGVYIESLVRRLYERNFGLRLC